MTSLTWVAIVLIVVGVLGWVWSCIRAAANGDARMRRAFEEEFLDE